MAYYKGLDAGRPSSIELPRSVYPLIETKKGLFTYKPNKGIFLKETYTHRLSPETMRLFHIFLDAETGTVSTTELAHKLNYAPLDNRLLHGAFIRVAIKYLRDQLDQASAGLSQTIKTDRGIGYRYEPHKSVERYYVPLKDRFVIEIPSPASKQTR